VFPFFAIHSENAFTKERLEEMQHQFSLNIVVEVGSGHVTDHFRIASRDPLDVK